MIAVDKQELFVQLRKRLSGLPQQEVEDRLTFYSEMIDDRMEEGLSEAEAVAAAGSVDRIVSQVVSEIPLAKIAKERIQPKRQLKTWEILLLVLGFPIWFPLVVSLISVIFSLYVSLWSVIVSLWAVFGSLVACACGILIGGIVFICCGNTPNGLAMIAGGSICAGLSIFLFYGCKSATTGISLLTKKAAIWIKNRFVKKEVG